MTDRRQQDIRDERFRRVRESLAARLREACATMSDEEREALLDRMATVEIKYRMRRSGPTLALAPEAHQPD